MTTDQVRARKRIISLVQNVIGAAILLWFAQYLWQRRAHFESILTVSATQTGALALLVAVTWVLTAAQSAVFYRASGIQIGFRENLLLTVGAAFGSYLPMLAGTVVRFHYMKRIHGLRYARSGSISWQRAILVTLSTALFGLAGTFGLALEGRPLSRSLLLLFAGLLLVPFVAFVAREPKSWLQRTPRARILKDFFDGIAVLRQQRQDGLWVFTFVALQQVCLAIRFSIAAAATGQSPSVALLCIMAPLAVFISFVSVTPAALGLREAVMGYATYATGTEFGSGIYVGTVDRAVLLAMVTVFGGASLAYLWYRIRRAEAAKLGAMQAP